MKKLTLTVLTIISLASCTKEYVSPNSNHATNSGKADYVPAIYEGNWVQDGEIPVTITRTKVFTDTLVWNMTFENGVYLLDTNGVDTYSRTIKILNSAEVVYNQKELFENGVESIVKLTK